MARRAVLSLVVAAAASAGFQLHVLDRAQDAFDLDLPSGCTMAQSRERLDFQEFTVRCGSVPYAGVYAGNEPQPGRPRSRTIQTRYAWPAVIQAWSFAVPWDQDKADRIAASVRLR